MIERINNPSVINPVEIATLVASGINVIIQFSQPCYARKLLREIDGLCQTHNERIEVRFYGHPFNCSVLRDVPSVVNLSVDCLQHVTNLGVLAELQHLKILSFGVFQLETLELLAAPNFQRLEKLRLTETHRNSFDLSPLSSYANLRSLSISGHSKGIQSLASLTKLENLSLGQIKKTISLEFVNYMAGLRSLYLILGGRPSISEISHQGLERLNVVRVLGFEKLQPEKFPALRWLQIENQIRVGGIAFSTANQSLEELRLLNCKTLAEVTGLSALSKLQGLRIAETNVDLGSLLKQGLPKSLNIFAFYTRKIAQDRTIRSRLDALGYKEFSPRPG